VTTSDSISFAHVTLYSVDTRIANTAEQRPGAGGFTFSDTPRLTVELRVGNEAAFHWLHEQWNARLFRYCFVLAGTDETLAGEFAQTTYLKIVRHIRELPNETALWNWIARAARSVASDHRKQHGRYRSALSRFTDWIRHAPSPSEPASITGGESALLLALDDAIEKLTGAERELLKARYYKSLPIADVAKAHGTTTRAIEGRLARLRRKLRNLIEAERHTKELDQ
jgi:RNA polymerase sigma factor (sigma-70 family)